MENNSYSNEIRYCLYARKSSEEDEKQALSIEAQEKEMMQIAERDNINVVCIKKEAHSAKESGQRPIFNEIIKELKQGKFDGILTWNSDRLSRNAGDLGAIIDLIDSGYLREIRTYNQNFKNTPNDKFLLTILGGQAKLENDNKSINVKRGLRIKTEKGYWIGLAPIGYLNDERKNKSGVVYPDPERAPIVKKMFEKVAYENCSGRSLYAWLKEQGFTTKNGKYLSLANIYILLSRPFYYGWFEYPKGSGNWCKGQHQPIISKEIFDIVQRKIKLGKANYKYGEKEFAFLGSMVCGNCGSNLSAVEKHKKLKNGKINTYIYYGCNRTKDMHCKNRYIREEQFIKEIIKLLKDIDIPEEDIKEKLRIEIERFGHLQKQVLKINNIERAKSDRKVDLIDYAKFILNYGSIEEKRQFMSMFKNKFVMKNKKINLIKN